MNLLSEEAQQSLVDSLLQLVEEQTSAHIERMEKEKQPPFLSRKKAAEWFGVSPMTLDRWVRTGAPVVVVNGQKIYSKESITNWLYAHEISSGK